MSRQRDYYLRHPAEREQRRTSLRALLALPSVGVEAIESGRMPDPDATSAAATRARTTPAVVERACRDFIWFFGRGGLTPR